MEGLLRSYHADDGLLYLEYEPVAGPDVLVRPAYKVSTGNLGGFGPPTQWSLEPSKNSRWLGSVLQANTGT